MIRIKDGSILDCDERVVVQSVNHKQVMGAGLAKQIRDKYPGIYDGYVKYCKMYDFPHIRHYGYIYKYFADDGKIICCVFGQENYGRDKKYTDYEALRNGLVSVKDFNSAFWFSDIAIPYGIGCGLAGGDWKVVSKIIDDVFYNYEFDVILYKFGS